MRSLSSKHLNNTRNPIRVYTDPMNQPTSKHPEYPEPTSPKRKEIPLISVPNDREMIAEEMAELFDEDRVSHQHGSSEPEAD
jgi:hypothetical protein